MFNSFLEQRQAAYYNSKIAAGSKSASKTIPTVIFKRRKNIACVSLDSGTSR